MGKAETVRTERHGKTELRLVVKDGRFHGLADGRPCAEGDDAERVWSELHDKAGMHNPKYFGFKDARIRFSRFFPNGFGSVGYRERERDYKVAAKAKLDHAAPLDSAVSGEKLGEALLSVYQATNMLSLFEKARMRDVLRGSHGDAVVAALASFAREPGERSLREIDRVLRPLDSAKWTIATYPAFLWQPERHMFLKPEATKDFAERVGHRFARDYQPRLSFSVYESLLDLVARTEEELADLKPRDRIDIQSFVWVVGDYREGREGVFP